MGQEALSEICIQTQEIRAVSQLPNRPEMSFTVQYTELIWTSAECAFPQQFSNSPTLRLGWKCFQASKEIFPVWNINIEMTSLLFTGDSLTQGQTHRWVTNERKIWMNEWRNIYRCFQTRPVGSLNGFINMKIMWIICFDLPSQITTQLNTVHHHHQNTKIREYRFEEWHASLQ